MANNNGLGEGTSALITSRDGNNMQSKIQEGTYPTVLKYLFLDTGEHEIFDLNLLAFLYARTLFQDILESFENVLMIVLLSSDFSSG